LQQFSSDKLEVQTKDLGSGLWVGFSS